MPHLALYRKYRSQSFGDLIGQEHVSLALQAAIDRGKISHAYLFTGPRGTGKTSSARILAKAINCEKGPSGTPCNKCEICTAITSGQMADVVEMDAASEAGVDEVRDNIVETARYAPMMARYKVFIIDEVHDLSAKAFDALLKTIEEPPAHVVFVLATTEFTKVPVTIRSRCHRFEFRRGTTHDLIKRLTFVAEQEQFQFEPKAIATIARMADGGFRDALTLLEQAAIVNDGNITEESVYRQLGLVNEQQIDSMLIAAAESNYSDLLNHISTSVQMGKDPREILESLLYRLSDLTYACLGIETMGAADLERRNADKAIAEKIGKEKLLHFRNIIAEAHKEIRFVSIPRLYLEVSLIKMCDFQQTKVAAVSAVAKAKTQTLQPSALSPKPNEPTEKREKPTPQDGSPEALWTAAVTHLKGQFKSAGAMLDDTFVSSFESQVLTIGFRNKFQYERILKRLDIAQKIREALIEVSGENGLQLKYVFLPLDSEEELPTTVQLPLEGEALVRAAEEIFQSKSEN